jgi:hypothetical protein
MSDKPNCYTCIHRGSVPGDAHSCCKHPDSGNSGGGNDMMSGIINMLSSKPVDNKLNIQAHEHGIRNGWFMYPWNFDPSWLISCDGHTAKEEKVEEAVV